MVTGCFLRRAIQRLVLQLPLMRDSLGHPNPDDIPVWVLAAALPCMVCSISELGIPPTMHCGGGAMPFPHGLTSPHIVLVMFSLITHSPSSTHQSPPEEPCTGSTSSLQTRACGKTGSLYSDGAPEAGSSGSGLVHLRSFVLTFLSADPGLNLELRALKGNFGACDHQCLENKPLLPFHKEGIFFTLGAKATAGGLWKLDSLVDTRADAPGCRERRWAGSSQSQQWHIR